MEEVAYAKVNLALHVRGREADGYHRLETLFAFAEDGDRLSVEASPELRLETIGPFAAALGGDNLVLRAAEALQRRCGVSEGADLRLDKRLPVAAGIGGGSADAAAALRLLSRFWGLEASGELLLDIAAGLGADVPACVRSETARGEGRGDRLTPAGSGFTGLPILLVNPGVPLPTAAVFKTWDGVDRGPLGDPYAGRNDLEPPAARLVPEIETVLTALRELPGVRLARMSGSGATCFALFESDVARDSGEAEIRARHTSWWKLASRLR